MNRLIAAKPLHNAVIALLAETLLDQPTLREHLTAFVIEQRQRTQQDNPGAAGLRAERDELKQMIQATIRSLKGTALQEAQEELQRMGTRRNEIEARLAQLDAGPRQDPRSIEQVVEEAIAVLAEESHRLQTLAAEPLREAVNRLVPSLVVDMETKTVEMSIALPVWATAAQPKQRKRPTYAESDVCPPATPWSPTGKWTHRPWQTARCEYHWLRGSRTQSPCYDCRREGRAA